MRIAYLSDLHLEFENTSCEADAPCPFDDEVALVPAGKADLIVLAGDIDIGERGILRADAISKRTDTPVIYVTGNHEAYGLDLATLVPRLRQAAWETDGRVIFLNKNVARFWFEGAPLVVLGCTLWTDYALHGAPEVGTVEAERWMQDHQQILWNCGPFRATNARDLHHKHRLWLDAQFRKLEHMEPRPKIVVVTHHAPIPEALGERAGSIAIAYASDLRPQIAQWPELCWIHGHTHHRHTTRIDKSIITSAPRGYPSDHAASGYTCGILDL